MYMRVVELQEAKNHLSRLIDEVNAGQEIVIARAGKPVARLVPLSGKAKKRKLGILAGRLSVSDVFDSPLPAEILADFEESGG